MRKQQELLDGLLAASDLSLPVAVIAEAAAVEYYAYEMDVDADDYVDGNPITQLVNWDRQIAVWHARLLDSRTRDGLSRMDSALSSVNSALSTSYTVTCTA